MMRLNPNKDHVLKIIEGIYCKNGHCPCMIEDSNDTICPCKDFREKEICHCKLYVK